MPKIQKNSFFTYFSANSLNNKTRKELTMTRAKLTERIKQGPFFLDGAMGTELFARSAKPGTCNDYLNIQSPEIVLDVHRAYFDAGSNAVITNTFGANKFTLKMHNLSDKVTEINTAAAKIARQAAGKDNYILGNIGPSGDFLQPLGQLEPEQLKAAFAEQAKALAAADVDAIIIETMTALDEITIAIEAVKSVCDLPIFASMSFDSAGDDFRTMMGVDVDSAVAKITSLDVTAVGFNCGKVSLKGYITLAQKYTAAVKASNSDTQIFAEPNAGLPELVDNKAVYNVTGQQFAEAAKKIHDLGIKIIGGCCGTNPTLITALTEKLG